MKFYRSEAYSSDGSLKENQSDNTHSSPPTRVSVTVVQCCSLTGMQCYDFKVLQSFSNVLIMFVVKALHLQSPMLQINCLNCLLAVLNHYSFRANAVLHRNFTTMLKNYSVRVLECCSVTTQVNGCRSSSSDGTPVKLEQDSVDSLLYGGGSCRWPGCDVQCDSQGGWRSHMSRSGDGGRVRAHGRDFQSVHLDVSNTRHEMADDKTYSPENTH